jgi:hypothetical protein
MSQDGNCFRHLEILTASETDDLFGLPCFTEEDRQLYFDLSPVEQEMARAFNFPVAAHFVLQLGYFKAKQQFFVYEQGAVLDDLRYIRLSAQPVFLLREMLQHLSKKRIAAPAYNRCRIWSAGSSAVSGTVSAKCSDEH